MSIIITCRYCKSSDIKVKFSALDTREQKWYICKCNDCNTYFLAPMPSEKELRFAYNASYYGEGKSKFGFSVESFIDIFRRKRAKNISRHLPQTAKILDIGCGNGRFLQHLATYGNFELHGIEMEGKSAERAALIKEIKLKIGPLAKHDYPGAYFDAITLFHVFEHLDKPAETLNIIKNILKKNGILILTFPNIAGWQAKVFKSKWYHLDPPRHLIFFDPVDFIRNMQNMGFTLIRKNGLSLEQNPYGWVQSCLNVLCRKREVLYERLKGNATYAPEYGKTNIFFQKLFFMFSFPFFALFDLIEALFGKSATVRITFRKD